MTRMGLSESELDTRLSKRWVERSHAAVWHPCTQMKRHEQIPPIAIARGAGAWLYDFDGNRYLDAISSWWVNLFGHAHPVINAALKTQLDTLEHAMLAGCTHRPVIELSERLAALTDGVLGHAFYGSDGASAVEIALKMSVHYWRNQGHVAKQEFACLANSYHGETMGALGVTDVALFRDAYAPLLRPAHIVASPAVSVPHALAEVRKLFAARHEHLAAFIVEPLVQCAAGMAMYDPVYLQGLRALCDEYRVLLIADEIAVGCGRTGTFFACEQARIWPDLLCLSKGITGGYLPLSVVLARDAIYQAFYDDEMARGFLHSHSYTGNPLACTAALSVLDLFEQEDVLARNRDKAALLAEHLSPLADHPHVRDLRQCGTIFAFDVECDPSIRPAFAQRFFAEGLKQELLIRPIGRTVYLMPPYVLADDELKLLAQRTRATLAAALSPDSSVGTRVKSCPPQKSQNLSEAFP